jgi:type I restriction enzyme S subunit
MAASYANYQFIYPGEYAMNHMDLLTGYMGLSDVFGVTSPDYRVFALTDTENCDPNYYLYVFQLGYKRKIFYGLGKGAANKGRWRMPAINFKNYDIPVPPIEEQKKIVDIIRKYEEKIDFAIQKVNEQIALLQEYRTRLISDVVTGQIDVRDEVIPEMR